MTPEAEIHAAAGDVPASLKCMRRATAAPDGAANANLWARLAEYYRRDYDWRRYVQSAAPVLEFIMWLSVIP